MSTNNRSSFFSDWVCLPSGKSAVWQGPSPSVALCSQHLAWCFLIQSVARRRLREVSGILLHCTWLPWSSGSHNYKRLRALPPPGGSLVFGRCSGRGVSCVKPPSSRSLPAVADLPASQRGLGGLLSPLALIKQPLPLHPMPAAALSTAWAEFMTRIHQIRREGTEDSTACRMRLDSIVGPSACRANPCDRLETV